MPRTVLVAVVGLVIFGVLALAGFVNAALGLPGRSGLALFGQAATVFSQALAAWFVLTLVRGIGRRRERDRVGAFALGLVMAVVLAILGLVFAVSFVSKGEAADFLLPTVGVLAVGGLFGAVAWSLSRPSARAWFASARPGDGVAPR